MLERVHRFRGVCTLTYTQKVCQWGRCMPWGSASCSMYTGALPGASAAGSSEGASSGASALANSSGSGVSTVSAGCSEL